MKSSKSYLSISIISSLLSAEVTKRKVIFVTHSMGGVLTEQFIDSLNANQKANVAGVIEFGVPHAAVNAIDITAKALKWSFFSGNFFQSFGFSSFSPEEFIDLWFRKAPVGQITYYLSQEMKEKDRDYDYKVLQFAEGQKTYFTQTGLYYFLVPPDKALCRNAIKIMQTNDDHRTLATLTGPEDSKYTEIIKFMKSCLQ